MDEVLKLKRFADFGIPVLILARECQCSTTSIRNYLSGASIPNGSKAIGIKEGLRRIVEKLDLITRE